MAEKKNTKFDRPGGYATPTGATAVQRKAALEMKPEDIRLFGDSAPPYAAISDQHSAVSTDKPSRGKAATQNVDSSEPANAATPRVASTAIQPAFSATDPDTRLYVGDCRDVLANLPDKGNVDLVFADPPFNWEVPYEGWKDGMPRREYERFTFDWIDGCIDCLAPHGSIFINIPDDTAAECVMHLKRRGRWSTGDPVDKWLRRFPFQTDRRRHP